MIQCAEECQRASTLYAREHELQTLHAVYRRVQQGAAELVLINGEAGAGKTSLVNACKQHFVDNHAWFTSKKYDLLEHESSYLGITQAFLSLLSVILQQKDTSITEWRRKIDEALGYNSSVLARLAPQFEYLLGKEQENNAYSAYSSEEYERFMDTLKSFIRLFGTKEHPLVFFLDDLHWADENSVVLLNQLLKARYHYSLFIISYRQNEIKKHRSVKLLIEQLKTSNLLPLTELSLKNLEFEDVQRYLYDKLRLNPRLNQKDLIRFSEYFFVKTSGNPLQIKLMIEEVGYHAIASDEKCRGNWDYPFAGSAGALQFQHIIMQRLERLSQDTKNLLELAACLGNYFSLSLLSTITRKNTFLLTKQLAATISSHLLKKNDNIYHFVHDQVQSHIYKNIGHQRIRELHYTIGIALLKAYESGNETISLANAIDQINKASPHTLEPALKRKLSQYNCDLAQEMKHNMAYFAAYRYSKRALKYIEKGRCWDSDNMPVTLTVFTIQYQYLFIKEKFVEAEKLFHWVVTRLSNVEDLIQFYLAIIDQKMYSGDYQDSLETGKKALSILDFALKENSDDVFDAQFERCKLFIQRKDIDDGFRQDKINRVSQINKILNAMLPPAYMADIKLFDLIVKTIVENAGRFGYTPEVAFGFANFGILLLKKNEFKLAQRCAQISLEVSQEKRNIDTIKTQFITRCIILPWIESHAVAIKGMRQLKEKALKKSDFQYTGYINSCIILFQLFYGTPLKELSNDISSYMLYAKKTKTMISIRVLTTIDFFITCYLSTEHAFSPKTLRKQETLFVQEFIDSENFFPLALYNIYKLQYLYMHDCFEEGVHFLEEAKQYLPYIPGMVVKIDYYFYSALILIKLEEKRDVSDKQLLNQVKDYIGLLETLQSKDVPHCFHKYHLATAEFCRLQHKNEQALYHFNQAFTYLDRSTFFQDMALAHELIALFLIENNNEQLAQPYVVKAYKYYQQWGARSKQILMESRFDDLINDDVSSEQRQFDALYNSTDYWAATQISHTISNKQNLRKALNNVLHVILKNSNSKKVAIILSVEQALFVDHEVDIFKKTNIAQEKIPIANWQGGPQMVVQYVNHNRELVVIDAEQNERFAYDPYVARRQFRQLLCMPIMSQTHLIGILYVENNFSSNTFTEPLIQFIELVASQIFNAIENTRSYEKMRQQIAVRKRTEKELFLRERHWHTLISICPVAIFRTNTKGDCLFVNEQACLLFGLHSGTTRFKNWAESVHPSDKKLVISAWSKTVREQIPFQEEYRICRTDGKILWIIGQAVEETTPGLTERTFIGTFTDITALRKAQKHNQIRKQQLARVERANTMGEMASGLAHQLNQPLTVIATLASVCAKKSSSIADIQLQTGLNKIMKQAYHAGEMVHRLKNLFCSGKLQKTLTNINDLIQQTLNILSENTAHVTITTIRNKNLPLIMIDPIQVEQVLINIIKNATEAMTQTITTHPILTIKTRIEKDYILISLQDNGPGIPSDVICDIFDPFFTTKEQGMGMGLAICKTIIEAHAGQLIAVSEPQVPGAQFLITLPMNEVSYERN